MAQTMLSAPSWGQPLPSAPSALLVSGAWPRRGGEQPHHLPTSSSQAVIYLPLIPLSAFFRASKAQPAPLGLHAAPQQLGSPLTSPWGSPKPLPTFPRARPGTCSGDAPTLPIAAASEWKQKLITKIKKPCTQDVGETARLPRFADLLQPQKKNKIK